MLIALLSDLHANLEALEACLDHAARAGAERHAFLGDLVGYGADVATVVAIVRRYVERGAIAVKGNHDQALDGPARYLGESAREAIELARRDLSPEQRRFLAALPLVVRQGDVTYVHASAARPARWTYVLGPEQARRSMEAAATTFTFCGHVHDQELFFMTRPSRCGAFAPVPGSPIPVGRQRRWLAVVGSAGQPRDGNPAAAYALFDPERAVLTFFRVAYDHQAAARKVRAAGLPESLAERLERGR